MPIRPFNAQTAVQHLFVARLGCGIVARQDVVSTKWIDGVEQQVPDTRVLMTGSIPDYRAQNLFDEAAREAGLPR